MGVDLKLGKYFVVTSGYSEHGGLVSKTNEALLFLAEGRNLYRRASGEEEKLFHDLHPVLKSTD